jgi:hypothetical protein
VKIIEFQKKIGGHGAISQFFPSVVVARSLSKRVTGRIKPYAGAADSQMEKCKSQRSLAAI